ncbi:MAG TPA: DUF308 domain-containing protein [Acidimicrobiales bacterium]|nr:DUF308 domain-containing protein [Acidimicrobiales bacterium]
MLNFKIRPEDLDEAARRITRRWWWYLLAGLAMAVLGVLLLIDIFDAVETLALLVAVALALEGFEQIANAPRYRPRWPGYVLGIAYLATSVWAVAWPDITLWALAAVVGIGFIVTGVAELVLVYQFHHALPNRWLLVLLSVVSIVTGVLAVAWPDATIPVLAVLLGVRVTMAGIALVVFGIGLRRLKKARSRPSEILAFGEPT